MGGTAQANDGAMLPLDSLFMYFTFDGDFLAMIATAYAGQQYQQLFQNNGTQIDFISGWINPNYPVPDAIMVTTEEDLMVTTEGDLMILTDAAA